MSASSAREYSPFGRWEMPIPSAFCFRTPGATAAGSSRPEASRGATSALDPSRRGAGRIRILIDVSLGKKRGATPGPFGTGARLSLQNRYKVSLSRSPTLTGCTAQLVTAAGDTGPVPSAQVQRTGSRRFLGF